MNSLLGVIIGIGAAMALTKKKTKNSKSITLKEAMKSVAENNINDTLNVAGRYRRVTSNKLQERNNTIRGTALVN